MYIISLFAGTNKVRMMYIKAQQKMKGEWEERERCYGVLRRKAREIYGSDKSEQTIRKHFRDETLVYIGFYF